MLCSAVCHAYRKKGCRRCPARGSKGVSVEQDIGVLIALAPHLCNVTS